MLLVVEFFAFFMDVLVLELGDVVVEEFLDVCLEFLKFFVAGDALAKFAGFGDDGGFLCEDVHKWIGRMGWGVMQCGFFLPKVVWGVVGRVFRCDGGVTLYLGITETDGLALALLGVMASAFAVIAMLLFCMLRNASRRDADVDDLLDEMERDEREERVKRPVGEAKVRDDWEKDEDWWKAD